jgi:vacuolar-type H+-ATPase subunit F/Vma7
MKRLKILKIWIAWPKAIPKIHGQKPNIDIIILTKFFVSNLEKKIKENLSCKRKKE